MPVCHHDVNMLTSSPSKVTAHLRSWNIFFFLFPKSQSSDVYQYYICLSLFLCTLTDVTLETLWEQTGQGFPSPTLFICTSILSCILQLKTGSHCPLSSSLFLLELHPLTQNTSNVFSTDSLQGSFMCFTGGMNAKTCSVPQKCIYLNDLLSEKKKYNKSEREQTENYILNVHQHIYGHQTHTTSAFTVAFTTLVKLPGMPILFMYITYWKIGGRGP